MQSPRNREENHAKEAAKAVKKSVEPHALKMKLPTKFVTWSIISWTRVFDLKDIDNLPEIATDPEELQNVISIFNNLEIKLLIQQRLKSSRKQRRKEDETARSNQSDMLDDPKDVSKADGQVPLLPERKK